jgi:hypothetical protein
MSLRSLIFTTAGLGLIIGLVAGLGDWSAGAIFGTTAVALVVVLVLAMGIDVRAHRTR